MLNSLLTNVVDKTRTVPLGEVSLLALLGFVVVFLGIAFLILVVWLVGQVMVKANAEGGKKSKKPVKTQVTSEVAEKIAASDAAEEITEETIAIITAAIMAYYQQNNPKCEFTVKRIKRI